MKYKLINMIKWLPLSNVLIDSVRPIYRWCRTKQLRLFYPNGGYLLCNGTKVFCNFKDNSYTWYDANSLHLYKESRLFERIVINHPGNVYLDIGAHFGYFSRVIAERIINTNRILLCLEPDKSNFTCLEKTMFDLKGKCKIELLPFALSKADGEIEMYESDTDCKHTYKDTDVTPSLSYKVMGVCLDNLVQERLLDKDRIAFIKIDVDGSESALFAGGIKTIRKHKPVIFMEFSPKMIRKAGEDPEEYFNMLNGEFIVYWYKEYSLQRVNHQNYPAIEQYVGDGISDLLLTYSEVEYDTETDN